VTPRCAQGELARDLGVTIMNMMRSFGRFAYFRMTGSNFGQYKTRGLA
jgi:hypothetical protein